MRISFGPFAFDPQNRLLFRHGAEVALPPRVLGVLELLIERPGQVVPRQDLLDRVWKDAFVTDTSLAEAVSFLRQALGDDPQSPRYIQTVHRRGYRFLAPVAPGSDPGQTPFAETAPPLATAAPTPTSLLLWTVAIFATALAVSAVWYGVRQKPPEPPPVTRFEVRPVAGSWFDRRAPAVAVSRDGQTIGWSACDGATGICGLFVRPIDRLDAARLAGTDGAAAPFFSPDGRWIGFFADGKLKKIAAGGGSPVVLADAPVPGGGAWNEDGQIVFNGLPAGGLSLASDQGGEVTAVTAPHFANGELRHAWPSWMAGNRDILFTVLTSPASGAPGRMALLSLSSKTWRTLRVGVTRAAPAEPGYLLAASGSDLQAITINDRTLTATGASDSALDGVANARGAAQFAATNTVLLAVRAPAAPPTIEWSDTPGRAIPNASRLTDLVLSPDGRRAAGVIADATGSDVWTVDLASGTLTRETFGGANVLPTWDAHGGLVYATRTSDGPFAIPGMSPARGDEHVFPLSIAADGRIAALQTAKDGRTTLVLLTRDKPPEVLITGPFDEMSAAFSPDGASIAYDADENGRREVYVQRLDTHARTQISTNGGERPSWSRDGRSIYFHEGARFVRVTPGAADGGAAARDVLFDRPDGRVVGVSPEGRLLIEREPPSLDSAIVVLQWMREVRERLPLPVASPR